MEPMTFENILLARTFDLPASFVESKMDSSVLVCLCQAVISQREVSKEVLAHFDWALATGAQMKFLASNSVLFFQLAMFPGAVHAWKKLIDAGYSLDKVVAKRHAAAENGAPSGSGSTQSSLSGKASMAAPRAGRMTSKLGLLCSAPYCLGPDLPELVSLLIDHGVDPNDRDSEGYAPLGRLNDQLVAHEAQGLSIDSCVPYLVRAVEVLLHRGAHLESILPIPEAFAARSIQECIRAKREKHELHQHVLMPDPSPDIGASKSL